MNMIARRLSEPSTWAAIAVLLTTFGVNPLVVNALGGLLSIAPDLISLGTFVASGGAAVVGAALPEGHKQ